MFLKYLYNSSSLFSTPWENSRKSLFKGTLFS